MTWIAIAIGGYLAILLFMFVSQRSLMYPASSESPDPRQAAAEGFRRVAIETGDGLALEHWYRPAADPGLPVVVVFHGNAGNIGHRTDKLAFLDGRGFGLFLVEYRGYGGNPGKPTEADLTRDCRGALDWLEAEGIAAARLVLYGESLGTGVAVKLAAERPVAAVILEAPYNSVAAVAQDRYWYLPARWLILDPWNVEPLVARIEAPLLVMHGGRDRIIPVRFGRALLAAAGEHKQGLFLSEAGHVDLLDHPEGRAAVAQILDQAASQAAPAE